MIGLLFCLAPAPFLSLSEGAALAQPAGTAGVAVDAAAANGASAADSVLRVYDLSNVDWHGRTEGDPLSVTMMPGVDFWEAQKDGVSEDESTGDVSRVLDMIYTLFQDEFQYEGRRLEETGTGRLLVVGPEALHQRIRLLLEYLQSVLHGTAELDVDVWNLPAGVEVPVVGTLVDASALAAWENALAGLGGARARYGLQARSGQCAVLKLTRDFQVILDYDVEIAQSATISDPIFGTASIGTRLAIEAAPSAGGLHLALTWKNSETIETGGRDVLSGFMISPQSGKPAIFDDSAHLADLAVLSRSASFATHLPAGQAMVVETSASLDRGGVREFLVIRQSGGSMVPSYGLQLDDAGGELVFADLGALDPPSLQHEGALMYPRYVHENLDRRLWWKPLLSVRSRRSETAAFTDYLQRLAGNALSIGAQDSWLIARPSGAGDASGALAGVRTAYESMLSPTDVLDVRVRLEQGGRERVVGSLPVRVGSSCSFVIGIEELEQPDYDVEVAQFAATEDPVMYTSLDGMVLYLDPLVESGGGIALRVRGGGHLLLGREAIELGGAVPGRVDQSEHAHLFVNETVSLRDAGDGVWSRTLGQVSGGTGAEDLALTIEVRR